MHKNVLIVFTAALFASSISSANDESTRSTAEIVRQFFSTFDDDEGWHDLLADSLVFVSPQNRTASKGDFVLLDKGFRQLVATASVKWLVAQDTRASALVEYVMVLPSGKSLTIDFAEHIEVRNDQIVSIRVLFDTAKFSAFLNGEPGQ